MVNFPMISLSVGRSAEGRGLQRPGAREEREDAEQREDAEH